MIISFEGVGGAGKSTLAQNLYQHLINADKNVLLLKPISRERLERITNVFPGKREKVWVCNLPILPPKVEALAYLSLLAYDTDNFYFHDFDYVLIDRYIDTVKAHVMARAYLNNNILGEGFEKWFDNIVRNTLPIPDLTFVVDTPLDLAEKRAHQREGIKYSIDDKKGFEYIRGLYLRWAEKEERFVVIDGSKPLKAIIDYIFEVVT